MWIKSLSWLAVFATMLAGCVLFRSSDPLAGTEWILVEINASAPLADTLIRMQFKEGKVTGTGGCNGYFGKYQVMGDTISFKEMGMTEMACMPQEVMFQEQDFQTALIRTSQFQLKAGKLSLLDKDGNEVLGFESKIK